MEGSKLHQPTRQTLLGIQHLHLTRQEVPETLKSRQPKPDEVLALWDTLQPTKLTNIGP